MAKESRINVHMFIQKMWLPWVFTHNNETCNYPNENQPYHIDIH